MPILPIIVIPFSITWHNQRVYIPVLLSIVDDYPTVIPFSSLQCGAPKIAKLVYNSNNYGLWYL